jgi:hypothetical protein
MAVPGLLFVSQAMLASWAEQGKIDFVGNVMTLLQGEGKGRSYALEPAVRFMKVIDGGADPNQLLAKVKQVSQLKEMGAEQFEDSVIMGDVGYEVQPGFLAEVSALQAAAAAQKHPEVRAEIAERTVIHAPLTLAPAQITAATAGPAEPPPVPTPLPPQPQTRRPTQPTPMPRELEEKRKEAEALARFLLDNLS